MGRLTTILELLRNFTADYLRQTNLLLGEPTPEGASQNDILAGFENTTAQLLMPAPPVEAPAPAAEEKKERKKRTHDPNAPKRPLTPYFLYMQHARSIIANDLGAEARKGAVQEEGQRRWAQMGPHEKQVRAIVPSLEFTVCPRMLTGFLRVGTTPTSTICVSTTPRFTRTRLETPTLRI